MDHILRTDHLANGVRVDFIDGSNRYFGDYHRLRIEIRCRIAVTPQLFVAAADPCAEAARVRSRLGDEILWVRHLERMGVAGGDLEMVRNEMIESFVKSSFPYLQSQLFPSRFVAIELAERLKKVRPFRLVK
ncbi:MAG: hypothetical protein A2X84_12565 [Desulfuromonadaceae bacterium GWC2_58_13]|nr:MAG: hypothetical protein A2X84_12565 [Desulfuromonadaceae bacterium GWC2_58_13]